MKDFLQTGNPVKPGNVFTSPGQIKYFIYPASVACDKCRDEFTIP
jgi:hypothetical protein